MKGRGRSRKFLFVDLVIRRAASGTKTRATKTPGSTSGDKPAGGFGVDAGGVWRILEEDAYVRVSPITALGGSVTGRSASHTFGDLRT